MSTENDAQRRRISFDPPNNEGAAPEEEEHSTSPPRPRPYKASLQPSNSCPALRSPHILLTSPPSTPSAMSPVASPRRHLPSSLRTSLTSASLRTLGAATPRALSYRERLSVCLAKDINWQDLEASILAGSTEELTLLKSSLSLSGEAGTTSCSPRPSHRGASGLSPPSSVRKSSLCPRGGEGNTHSRNHSFGGMEEAGCDDFEAALKSAATRLAPSRWEELFQMHQAEREQQERERRESWRLSEQSMFRSRTLFSEAVQAFEKTPEVSPTRSVSLQLSEPAHAMPHRGTVSEKRAWLLEQGLLPVAGLAPSPASCGPTTTSAGGRNRSGSFQGDRSSAGKKRPQSVQLPGSAADNGIPKRGVFNTPYGTIVLPDSEPAEADKPKGKELKKLMKEQAKLRAQQEKEAQKEAKRKKQEEKKKAKEFKKQQAKAQAHSKGRTTTLISFHNPPRLVNLASFQAPPPEQDRQVLDKVATVLSPLSNSGPVSPRTPPADRSHSAHSQTHALPSWNSGGSASSPHCLSSSAPSSPIFTARRRAEKTRVVKVEELDPRVWKFEEPDTEDTVTLGGTDADGVQLVSGASLYKIIQRITFAQYPDPSFVTTFLLTYRLFLSPLEVLDLLILRFDTPPPPESDEAAFLKTTQLHIRLRVINVLKQWLTHYFHDFRSEPALLDRLGRFIDDVLNPEALVTASEQLKLLIEKKQSENADKTQEKAFQFSTLPPTPILPVKLKRPLKLLDLHPLEVARQLTLIEHNLYRTITPCECLRQRWTSKDKATLAPNIIALIDRFNKVSRWCCSEIVREKDLKSRAVILNRFILIASQCRELNNFNGVMEIMAGLQNAAAYRLKKTWNLLPNKTWDIWEELTHLMSSEDNFRVFREALHKINPPCIPYLGVFLTDLTFIEDGNPDFLRPDLINITKLRYGARVIQDIKQYQQTPYCLEPVPFIHDWLMSRELYNEKDLYDHSDRKSVV